MDGDKGVDWEAVEAAETLLMKWIFIRKQDTVKKQQNDRQREREKAKESVCAENYDSEEQEKPIAKTSTAQNTQRKTKKQKKNKITTSAKVVP